MKKKFQFEPQVVKVQDLDVVGSLFGMKLLSDGMVALYVEDDENYFYKCSFHKDWLMDLLGTTGRMIHAVENDFVKG